MPVNIFWPVKGYSIFTFFRPEVNSQRETFISEVVSIYNRHFVAWIEYFSSTSRFYIALCFWRRAFHDDKQFHRRPVLLWQALFQRAGVGGSAGAAARDRYQ